MDFQQLFAFVCVLVITGGIGSLIGHIIGYNKGFSIGYAEGEDDKINSTLRETKYLLLQDRRKKLEKILALKKEADQRKMSHCKHHIYSKSIPIEFHNALGTGKYILRFCEKCKYWYLEHII